MEYSQCRTVTRAVSGCGQDMLAPLLRKEAGGPKIFKKRRPLKVSGWATHPSGAVWVSREAACARENQRKPSETTEFIYFLHLSPIFTYVSSIFQPSSTTWAMKTRQAHHLTTLRSSLVHLLGTAHEISGETMYLTLVVIILTGIALGVIIPLLAPRRGSNGL